ncbi:hypothetical protein H5P28_16840 [Ruficoccus amylovorans]|uniref:PEP-CTERM sorting domain-containing protein n=1 Tax=Ruficoccus amylovorans TaxID=1804625 RepID=A0A842HJV6_9BACT|nr:hypothetical protein [Ruficoccus amylovorans]MBC2595934.1 hypothetical protein [Ruficoccus amylovorans]
MKDTHKTPFIACILSAGLFSIAANTACADSVYWSGGTGLWSVPTNWDGGSLPTSADNVYLDKGGETQLSTTQTITYLQAGRQYAGAGSLVIQNGGTLNVTGAAGSTGAINLSPVNGAGFGQITIQSGGALNVTNGSVFIGRKGEGLITQTGGAFTVGENLQIGRDNPSVGGTYSISGGTLSVTGDFEVASSATTVGRIEVTGNWDGDNSINVGGDFKLSSPVSVLAYNLNAAGIEEIMVAGSASLNNSTLELNFADGFIGQAGTYDLLTATSISTSGLVLDDNLTNGFSVEKWEVVSGGNGQILQVTVIPEPNASCSLLGGLVAIGLAVYSVAKRRR